MENHPKRLGVLLSFLQKILVILGLGFWFPFSKKMENHPKRRLPSLTDDLIHEILVRLPAKSVGRFRCVSKRWLSDLTDPKFIRAHSSRSPTSGFFLFTSPFDPFDRAEHIPFDSESRLPDPTLSFLDNDGLPPQFFDCCNGLILCGKPYCRPWKGDGIYVLAVCNPLTRACHFIPVAYSVFSISREAFLAFDPSVSSHFKVVSVRGGFTLIYSSETRKWKLLTTEYYNTRFIRSSVWSGNLVLSSFNDSPLCLDMRREQLEWLPRLPGPVNGKELWRRYLGESGGRLHFIVPITDESVTHFDIWELMPGSTEWSVLYKIDTEHIKDMYPEVKPYGEDQPDLTPAVVHFSRDEGGLGDRLLLSVPGKIVCYHLRDKSFTTVCNAVPVYSTGFARSQLSFYPLAHTLSPFYDSENAPTSLKDGISWPTDWDIVTRSGR